MKTSDVRRLWLLLRAALGGVLLFGALDTDALQTAIALAGGRLDLGAGVTLDAVSLTVGADATLGGAGTVSAPVSLAGSVSPGLGAASTVGTLTFTDTLTFLSGSHYLCHAATATDVDRLSVTGAVTGTTELTCTRTGTAAPGRRVVIAGGTGSSYSLVTALDPALWQLAASGNDLRLWYGPPVTLAARQESDSGFGNGGAALLGSAGSGHDDGARALALGAAGRLLTAGRAAAGAKGDSTGVFSVSCFLADGTPDADFGGTGTVQTAVGSDSEAFAVVVQADGKIVAAGRTRNAKGDDDIALVRYDPDGTLDTSFGTDGIVTTDLAGGTDVAYALVLQGWDQRLIAAGVRHNGAHYDLAATRYTTTGSIDSSYGSAGTAVVSLGTEDVDDAAFGAALQKDGMLVLAGQTVSTGRQVVAVVRLDPTGTLDPDFAGGAGAVTLAAGTGDAGAAAVAVQPDGRLLVAGSAFSTATGWDLLAARWLSAGSADASFGGGSGLVLLDVDGAQADDYAFGLALQPDGRIVLAGSTTVATPTPAHTVMLLTGLLADGDLDLNFGQVQVAPGAAGGNAAAYAVVLAPGGKVVAAGTASNGIDTDTAVAQLQGAAWEVRATHGTGVGAVWTAVPDGYIESRTAGLTCVAVRLDVAVDPASVSTGSLSITDHLSNSFTASAVTVAADQRTLIFTFAALPNARRYTFTLAQTVTASTGLPLAAVQSLSLGVLAGDADSDGNVDADDLTAIRACSSLVMPAALARYDLNSDGRINVGDLLATRIRIGVETLP